MFRFRCSGAGLAAAESFADTVFIMLSDLYRLIRCEYPGPAFGIRSSLFDGVLNGANPCIFPFSSSMLLDHEAHDQPPNGFLAIIASSVPF
jgi:hypothetical protein